MYQVDLVPVVVFVVIGFVAILLQRRWNVRTLSRILFVLLYLKDTDWEEVASTARSGYEKKVYNKALTRAKKKFNAIGRC